MASRLPLRPVTFLLAGSWSAAAFAAPEAAKQSDNLVDSIGINIHAAFYGTPYNDWNRVISAINDLGIRYVRDDPTDIARLNQLTAATGAKIDLIMQDTATYPGTIDIGKLPSVIARAKSLTGLAMMEGPNEPQVFDDWVSLIHAWQPALYQQVKADPALAGKPLIMPSVDGYHLDQIQDLKQYADGGTLHHYAVFGAPITWYMEPRLAQIQDYVGAGKPMYVTETGYHNAVNNPSDSWPGVPGEVAARYYPAIYTEMFNASVVKTFTYELIDPYIDPSNTDREMFGLLHADWTPKPAYYAVKNTIALLKDPGPDFTPTSLDYALTGGDTSLHHTLLQKRDGSFELALWRDIVLYDSTSKTDLDVGTLPISLTFGQDILSAETFLPSSSGLPTAQYAGSISQLNLSVPGEMMILHLTPAQERSWNVDADGDWSNPSNWQNGVPVGTAVTAGFGSGATTPRTVTLTAPQMVRKLTFDNANTYTIAGSQSLTLDSTAGPAAITVASGSHAITAPLMLAGDTTVTVAPPAGMLTVGNLSAADVTITKQGAGTLKVNHVRANGLTINEGSVAVLPSNLPAGNCVLHSLSIAPGAALDLNDNKLIVTSADQSGSWNGSAYAGITGLIATGRNGSPLAGKWRGSGIVTSQSLATTSNLTSIGVATASQARGIAATATSIWAGEMVTGSDTLVMYTYAGDANLDGKINVDDYTRIDFNVSLGSAGWCNGDFNYDGKINVDDYTIIDFNVGIQGAPFSMASSASGLLQSSPAQSSAVPEPGALAAISLGLALLPSRQRRGSRTFT